MKIILIIALVLLLTVPTGADVFYDNITQSNYKTIIINDDLNYKYLNEYKYDVYINGFYQGSYKIDEKIFIPDNSNITVYVPSPVKTDIGNTTELIKRYGIIIISVLLTFVIILAIIVKIYKQIRR